MRENMYKMDKYINFQYSNSIEPNTMEKNNFIELPKDTTPML